nr:PHP-associated domain-containing protein [Candidatus Sigynarchaeota archaeon]
MGFHQFKETRRLAASGNLPPVKNPLDIVLGSALKSFGLDMLAEYFSRFSKNDASIKPWMPASLDPGMFLIDTHCHTALSDGEGDFESILRQVGQGKYLDGLLLSNHVWSLEADDKTRIPNEKVLHQSYEVPDIVADLKRKRILPDHFISFPGTAEFVTKGTDRFPKKGVEIIGTGLSRSFIQDNGGLGRIRKLLAEDLVDLIHNDGGVAIVVHPFYFENAYSPRLWRTADAIEIVNQTTHMFVEPATRAFVKKVTMDVPLVDEAFRLQPLFGYFSWRARVEIERHPRPVVGSSDAHVGCFAGTGCTMFREPITSLEDFRTALRRRKSAAMLNPRWEAQAEIPAIIDAIWHHWGKKIVRTMFFINSKWRAVIPLLKIATDSFKRFKDTPFPAMIEAEIT